MSKQLDYYQRNKDAINAQRRKGKAAVKRKGKAGKAESALESAWVNKLTPPPLTSSSLTPAKQHIIRLHALGRIREYKQRMELQEVGSRVAAAGIKANFSSEASGYFFQIADAVVRVTSNSVSAWAEERDKDTSVHGVQQAQVEAKRQIRFATGRARKLLKLDLKAKGRNLEEHIAFQNDEYSINVIEHEFRIEKRTGGSVRMLVDASKHDVVTGLKIPEIEFMHRIHAYQDALKYANHVEKIYKDVWGIDKQLQFNQQSISWQRGATKFFVKHNKLIDQISELIRDLREERKRGNN